MGVWDHIPVHQGLSLLKRHRRASAAAATALCAMLLTLLPRVILSFMLGMIASPILIAVTVAYLVRSGLQLEKPQPSMASNPQPIQERIAHGDPNMEQIMDTVVQELARAPAGDYPPYPVWGGNEYQGWLWTMDNDKFDRTDTLANWPPKVPGACKWWAHLQGKMLIIARDKPLPEEGSHSGKGTAASQAHGHETEDALIVREIDLQGCSVSVLTEALKGKSHWLRKAPLELTHPERPVFEGQQTLLLFAAGSAAKEQWYIALSAATALDGGAGGSVHALYSTFCDYVREHALVAYPQADEQDMQHGALSSAAGGKSRNGQGRWLSRWLVRDGASRKQGKERAGSKKPESKAPPHKQDAKPTESRSPSATASGPVLNPTERMDMLWMGKQLPPTPKPAKEKGKETSKLTHGSPSSPSVLAATSTGRVLISQEGAFRQASAKEELGTELQDLRSPGAPKSALKKASHSPSAVSLPAMRLACNEDSQGNEEDDEDGVESDNSGSSEDESQATSPRSPAYHISGQPLPELSSRRAGQKRHRRKQRASAAAHLPSLPVEAAVNMLLARTGFDLLRSAAFKQRVHAHIQRKLDVLRVPEFIQSIEVIDVELGSMVPGISNLRALPCPTGVLWPQAVFDLDYGGGLTVIIEAKLDVRDSASWDTLDKAIDRLGGAHAANATAAAAVNGQVAAAAAAANAMSPGNSDEDEGVGAAAAGSESQKAKKVGQLQRLRNFAASRMRNLAEITAEHISKMHLRIQVDIHSLQGTVCTWVPPPPNDRLWFGFITPPDLKAEATPILTKDVRGRAIMVSYQASSVPKWVADKLQSAITKNLTLPSCADIPLPHLLPVDHPDAAAALPGFLRALQGDTSDGHATTPDSKRGGRDKRHRGQAARADSMASGGSIPDAEPLESTAPAKQEEAKPHRGFLRWTRRSGRRSSDASKATIDMEPVIQTEKDARRLSGARRSHTQLGATTSSKEQQENAQPSQEGMQSPDVELSTFVTADEYAREGKELQSLRSARQDNEEVDRRHGLGPMAAHSLVMSDCYGEATLSTTLHEDGHIETQSESTAAEAGASSSLAAFVKRGAADHPGSLEETSSLAEALPEPLVEQEVAASTPLEDSAEAGAAHVQEEMGAAMLPMLSSGSADATTLHGTQEGIHGHAQSGSLHESTNGEEDDPDMAKLGEAQTPVASGEMADEFTETASSETPTPTGKSRQSTGAESSSKQSPGAWKEIGGAMGKKYLEAFKNHKSITYSQGKKMATSLAGQAQEQMRKALAAREKASKAEKSA